VTEPVIVFSPSFPPFWEEVDKYYNLVLGKDTAGFEADKSVAVVLRKMFTTALEVPKDEVAIEEKIHIATEEVSIEGPREAFIGYVMESVVKDRQMNDYTTSANLTSACLPASSNSSLFKPAMTTFPLAKTKIDAPSRSFA
jgi:hypothetical protein